MDLALVPFPPSSPSPSPSPANLPAGTYRECLKNHAASIGGQAFDGCGEFMAGSKGQSLACAACGCHRNFHRRESEIPSPLPVAFFPPLRNLLPPARRRPGPIRKRRRTKFTDEQKDQMKLFAEKLGWRIQKHDAEPLRRFCAQIGIEAHALKIWMHNHKNHFPSDPAAAVDPRRI